MKSSRPSQIPIKRTVTFKTASEDNFNTSKTKQSRPINRKSSVTATTSVAASPSSRIPTSRTFTTEKKSVHQYSSLAVRPLLRGKRGEALRGNRASQRRIFPESDEDQKQIIPTTSSKENHFNERMGSSFHPLDLELVSPLDTEAITSSLATGRDHTLSSNQINSKHSLNTRDFPAVSVETAPFINNSRPIPKQKSTSSTHSKGRKLDFRFQIVSSFFSLLSLFCSSINDKFTISVLTSNC